MSVRAKEEITDDFWVISFENKLNIAVIYYEERTLV